MSREKTTIGLLVSGIVDEFTETVTRGVMHAAKKADVNLVVLPCKYLDRDLSQEDEIRYEYQYNTIFDYAKSDKLDGLVIMADCIGCHTTRERMREALSLFEGMQSVLLASKMEGFVGVTYDNFSGIQEGLEYLIRNRNCRRFAMLGGPDDNTDARERRQAFCDTLQAHGIAVPEGAYVAGDLSMNDVPAYRRLLDQNPDVEAIFCVNDYTAIGLMEEMKARGLMPGEDIYVLGYDNTVLSAKVKPSISSIWADSTALGIRGMEMLLEMIAGKRIESVVLPTQFIRRESFGIEKTESGEIIIDHLDDERIQEIFDGIFYRNRGEGWAESMEHIRDAFFHLLRRVEVYLDGNDANREMQAEILRAVDAFFEQNAMEYADIEKLMYHFERVCKVLAAKRIKRGDYEHSQTVYSQVYRRIIDAMDVHYAAMQKAEFSYNYSIKMFVKDTMQFKNGHDESYGVLLQKMSWLDIHNAYLYIFEEPILHPYMTEFRLPEFVNLKAFLQKDEVHLVPAGKQRLPVSDIFDNPAMSKERRTMALLPLFSNEMLYGILLCDLRDKLFDNGEFLANQLGSAVKMIDLLNANEKIRKQLEANLITLQENNVILDNLSKSDLLTGILNRRGFYTAAERFLADSQAAGRDSLVIYVDMDNLKIINDRYGHEEGDFALQTIGGILHQTVGEQGVTGRIGGDEFACIMEYDREDEGASVIEEIREKFRAFNQKSVKEYAVNVSVGTFLHKAAGEVALNKALSLADGQLYLAKQRRKKSVEKVQNL